MEDEDQIVSLVGQLILNFPPNKKIKEICKNTYNCWCSILLFNFWDWVIIILLDFLSVKIKKILGRRWAI